MQTGRVEFVHRSWPADPEQLAAVRHELTGWLAPLRLTENETVDVVLAVDEAVANAVSHAYGADESGAVELTLWTEDGVDGTTLSIEVVDHGRWRTPAEPTAPGEAKTSGRGIPLMNSTAEAVLIHYDERGSRVLLRHRLRDQTAPQDGTVWTEPPSPSGSASRGSGVGTHRPATEA